jgi:gliding motility-associated-like protein
VAAGGTPSYTYTLENATGTTVIQSGNTTGDFTGIGYGLYTVKVTDQNNCPFSDTITVPQAPFNYYTDTATSTSCYGSQYTNGSIELQGYSIPNGPFQYSINGGPFQISPYFFNLAAGSYQVTAQDNYGCDTTFTVIVPEPLPATVQILPGDSTITAGSTLQLTTVFGPYSTDSITGYAWSPGTGMSCIDCPSPEVSPYANQTIYTVIITYNQGCTASATVQINTNGEPPMYIPNAFTPNGDGVTDVWYVFGTGIKDIKIMVFDRWGEKVFESDDQSVGWDGTYKGQLEAPDVFVYEVNAVYLDGSTLSRSGSITLIR